MGQAGEREAGTCSDGGLTSAEQEELARATTNEFGEFQLEFSPADGLLLTVSLKGESLMVSALPAYTSATGSSGSAEPRL